MWFTDLLLNSHSAAQAVFVISLGAALGLALGHVRIRGIGLGISGCLFSGLALGHFGLKISPEVLEFLREFGLILFVYTVGLQVGPGFVSALKKQGLRMNLLAAGVVVMGLAMSYATGRWLGVPPGVAVGLFSGATTNTPSLGAAQSLLVDLVGRGDPRAELPALGYAVAYPFGVLGVILLMITLKAVFRVNTDGEAESYRKQRQMTHQPLETVNIEVTNRNLDGARLEHVPGLAELGVVVSRLKKKGRGVEIAYPDSTIHIGDILHAIGPSQRLRQFEVIVGSRSETDLKALPCAYASRRVVVTRNRVAGKRLEEFAFMRESGAVVTRIGRADIEFTPTSNVRLQFGDVLTVVGDEPALRKAAEEMGNSLRALAQPQIIPIFIGLMVGLLIGSIPFQVPGLPVPMKLGLAGGALLAAIGLSLLGHLGPVIWYLPVSSNLVLREIGIVLFLTCVGLKAGGSFVETLVAGDGLLWMGWGALVTVVPLLAAAFFARIVFKMNFLEMCGLMAGSMTDPPALFFANSLAPSDAPSVAYSSVYPMVIILRVVFAQILVLLLI